MVDEIYRVCRKSSEPKMVGSSPTSLTHKMVL